MCSNSNLLPLVLVNLGPIPKYLKANILYIDKTFPERRKILIGNIDKPKWLEKSKFDFIPVDTLKSDWPDQFLTTGNQKHFRNDFWFKTKARLLLLPKVMRQESLSKALHIENDVWIHPNFPFTLFESARSPLAFPRVDFDRGIASTLFINGEEGMNMLDRACIDWPTFTDMHILGKILNTNSKVLELKSTLSLQNDFSEDWLFDGAKLGMYLYGSDPRNSHGIVKRFAHSPMRDLELGQRIYIDSELLMLQTENGSHPIASLHIHSKDISIFKKDWKSSVMRQLRKDKLGIDFVFNWPAFLHSLLESIERIVRKVKQMM